MKKEVGYVAKVREYEGSWDRPDGYVLADTLEAGEAKKAWIHTRDRDDEYSRVGDFKLVELTEEGVKLLNRSVEKAEWILNCYPIDKYIVVPK